MKACNQPTSLEVANPFDWANLVWSQSSGQNSFTPGFSGDHWSCSAHTDIGFFVVNGAIWNGQMTYNGPAVSANLHVTWLGTGTTASGYVQVSAPGFVLSEQFAINPIFEHAFGTYDFPFTIPDTAGGLVLITVQVNWQITGTGPFNTMSTAGLLT